MEPKLRTLAEIVAMQEQRRAQDWLEHQRRIEELHEAAARLSYIAISRPWFEQEILELTEFLRDRMSELAYLRHISPTRKDCDCTSAQSASLPANKNNTGQISAYLRHISLI